MRILKKILMVIVVALVTQGLVGMHPAWSSKPASEKATKTSKEKAPALSKADQDFLCAAAQGGLAEIKMGKLAAKRGKSADVRAFGTRMVNDHSKIDKDLAALAASKHCKLPKMMTLKDAAKFAELDLLRGGTFDRKYMEFMRSDHQGDASTFTKEAKSADDAEVRAFASRNLATIEQHLKIATSVDDEVAPAPEKKK